jgi:prolyl 4-hydroxylase
MSTLDNAVMSVTVTVPSGLRDWIRDNLQRGTPPAALIDALVIKNFEPRIARGIVEAVIGAQKTGEPQASVYEYETPRIASGSLISAAGHEVRVLQRLQRPLVVLLERLLSDAECERLIDLARPRLRPATIVETRSGEHVAADRKGDGAFFQLRENALIARLDERLSALMNCPVENGEGLQVLRYGPGGEYPPHVDFLAPTNSWSADSIGRSGQRVSTLIVYLNDVAEGGETLFPVAGLSICPRRGNAVYFEYSNSRQQVDPSSLHAGAPVRRGEKWIVTKWMRARRFVSAGANAGHGMARATTGLSDKIAG